MAKYVMDCTKCGRKYVPAQFDLEKKTYTCSACGNVDKVEPENKACKKCGQEYVEYTWFDPKKCPNCGKVFNV